MTAPRTPMRAARTDDGVTLIELVVAIGVLMVVLVASLAVFITVQKSQQTAEGTDRAIQLANDRIERIRQLDWIDIGFHADTYADCRTDHDGTGYLDGTGSGGTADPHATDIAAETPVVFPTPDPHTAPPSTATARPCVYHSNDGRIKPVEVTDEIRNTFTVRTYITWGTHPTDPLLNPQPSTHPGRTLYGFKRVRVVVTWHANGNGGAHQVVNETWFAPQAYDEAPPRVPVRP